eukprot:TRINITY_DN1720_c0_g1_i4.p1 TRINITY_DN1720_c0_g1~~TRINITY_DN1720_c0_g1_i4.p1  ORF type:complete len:404 (-),score=46.83 TRINITY_DN1720_c0_g1_i4:213-1424(-)
MKKILKKCFRIPQALLQGEQEEVNSKEFFDTFESWNSREMKEWLASTNLSHLEKKFINMSGRDLLQLSHKQCFEMARNEADAQVLIQKLQILKARYVDYLVGQGVTLPLAPPPLARLNSGCSSFASTPSPKNTVVANPVQDICDPVRKMLLVSRMICDRFATRGKFFTVRHARRHTGIPTKLIHDVVNTLVSIQVIAPLNDGFTWLGIQRLQLKNDDILLYQNKITSVNLTSLTPRIVHIFKTNQSSTRSQNDVPISLHAIANEILREHTSEESQNKDLLNDTVRDACMILVGSGILEHKKNIQGYVFRWILSHSQIHIDSLGVGRDVLNSAVRFDCPGQVVSPQNSNQNSRASSSRNYDPQPGGESPIPNSQTQVPYGDIDTEDPGSVTSLAQMFANFQYPK